MNYTSIEQSKKLIEAGLDPNTADMYYVFDPFIQDINGLNIGKPEEPQDVPCWSLGALIDLMPDCIETKRPKNIWFPSILPASNGVCYEGMDGNENKITFLKIFSTGTDNNNNTMLDNIVKMVLWLLENNYIKKLK